MVDLWLSLGMVRRRSPHRRAEHNARPWFAARDLLQSRRPCTPHQPPNEGSAALPELPTEDFAGSKPNKKREKYSG